MKLMLTFAVMLLVGTSISAQQSQPSAESPRQVGLEILTDTKGFDFNNYVTRLIVAIRRNWEYVRPESEHKGDKGMVWASFQIYPDGRIQAPDPIIERTSGEKALDNAARAAINASNPFEPLPSQFHGPFLRLRVAFIYKGKPA